MREVVRECDVRLIVVVAVTALLLHGCRGREEAASSTLVREARAAQTRPPIAESRRTAITEAVAQVAPAVVTVQTETVERGSVDPFDAFSGRAGTRVLPGLGSGFITRADGIVITNAHVVVGATRISVALADGTSFPARLLGADTLNDLAVLKIEGRDLPVVKLGNSSDLVVGEWAIAIGNPFGFVLGNSEPSVTAGVISATGRNLAVRAEGPGIYVDMIQTDASINPGNSGGPLVNAVGEVIGVNSSIYSPSGGSIGLGFAIPINRVKRVTEDLLAHGTIRRPWVGLKVRCHRSGARAGHSAPKSARWFQGSPAAQAGLRTGDVLLRSRDRGNQDRLRLGRGAARAPRRRACPRTREAKRTGLSRRARGRGSAGSERAKGGGPARARAHFAHAADSGRAKYHAAGAAR